jgi:hypothetical protein
MSHVRAAGPSQKEEMLVNYPHIIMIGYLRFTLVGIGVKN